MPRRGAGYTEITVAGARLHHLWISPQPAGGFTSKGAEMADNYRKDPKVVSRLTPEQYRITQQAGTEPALPAHDTGSTS
jgi:hypothetical protein